MSKRSLLIIDAGYTYNGSILHSKSSQMIDWLSFVSVLTMSVFNNEVDFYNKFFLTFQTKNTNILEFHRSLTTSLPEGPGFNLREFKRRRKQMHSLDKEAQQEIDILITTLILTHAYEDRCDQIVLFARKGAYLDALSVARNRLGKELIIIGFRASLSSEFQEIANRVIWVDDIWDIVHRTILPDLLDFSIGADRKGKKKERKSRASSHRRDREYLGGGSPMGPSGDELAEDYSVEFEEPMLDTYETQMIQLIRERTDAEVAESLNYQLASQDKNEYVIREETSDYGILMAEDRNRRSRQGRPTLEDEESDHRIAEVLQLDYIKGHRRR